ncbi:hypothetical protein [Staphylococcus warneri]|uniref:hypothetical protein n=1 Tax=Staphylococcus warneri TaxID=1292 RepID=UPI001040DB18|nr:hypothetical protein [Staphylococcus warneri]MDK4265632.1 hypothetical protein [Staphylococcus warneri]TBW79713.1 hypothetical protein EQ810_10715 [Staphylococcus warneri]
MHNDKIELKNILFIAFIFIFAIIVFVFSIGYIIRSVDPEHSVEGYTIAISFVGIFATFGGAFLGAKISGDNALKLSNREQFIKNTKELFNLISDYNKSASNTLQEIKCNILICSELKENHNHEMSLKTFEATYNEMKDIYLRIKISNQYVFLSEKLIEEIKPPSQLEIVNYSSTISLVNVINENGENKKVLDQDFYDYQDTLSKANENIHKIIKNIDRLRDELIEKV